LDVLLIALGESELALDALRKGAHGGLGLRLVLDLLLRARLPSGAHACFHKCAWHSDQDLETSVIGRKVRELISSGLEACVAYID